MFLATFQFYPVPLNEQFFQILNPPTRVLEQKGTLYKSEKDEKGQDIFEEIKMNKDKILSRYRLEYLGPLVEDEELSKELESGLSKILSEEQVRENGENKEIDLSELPIPIDVLLRGAKSTSEKSRARRAFNVVQSEGVDDLRGLRNYTKVYLAEAKGIGKEILLCVPQLVRRSGSLHQSADLGFSEKP